MIKIGSLEQPAGTGRRRRLRSRPGGAGLARLAALTAATAALTAAMLLAGAATVSAAAQAEESEGRDVGETLIGAAVVLVVLIALFLVIRWLRRRG